MGAFHSEVRAANAGNSSKVHPVYATQSDPGIDIGESVEDTIGSLNDEEILPFFSPPWTDTSAKSPRAEREN